MVTLPQADHERARGVELRHLELRLAGATPLARPPSPPSY